MEYLEIEFCLSPCGDKLFFNYIFSLSLFNFFFVFAYQLCPRDILANTSGLQARRLRLSKPFVAYKNGLHLLLCCCMLSGVASFLMCIIPQPRLAKANVACRPPLSPSVFAKASSDKRLDLVPCLYAKGKTFILPGLRSFMRSRPAPSLSLIQIRFQLLRIKVRSQGYIYAKCRLLK